MRYFLLCTVLCLAFAATAGELQPALNADPTYPTKNIKEITVLGFDAREDASLKLNFDLLLYYMNSAVDKRGYKVKGFKTGFAAGFANLKSAVNRVAHGKDTTMTPEDSVLAVLTVADLTTNYETWLSGVSETVGNWILVLAVNAAEAPDHGANYDCHAILTGYLFDRAQHSLIWSDRVEKSDVRSGVINDVKNNSSTAVTNSEAMQGMMADMILKDLSRSIAKRGKFFRLPEEHEK